MNAVLDGVDPGSDSPHERMKFAVYQRRLLLNALRDKAMLLAMIGGNEEKASAVAEAYIEAAIPVTRHAEIVRKLALEEQVRQIESMGPVRARAITGVPGM